MQLKKNEFEKVLRLLPSKERFKFFFLFVLLSFIFWFSTKLSNTNGSLKRQVEYLSGLDKKAIMAKVASVLKRK